MPIKINYMGFSWDPGFAKGEVLAKFLTEGDELTCNLNETNVLIIGSSLSLEEYEILKSYKGLRILFLSEPISNLEACSITHELFKNDHYHAATGCISNDLNKSWVKYPIYKYVFSYGENTFNEVNEYVKSCNINEKRFCFLANRHDWGNTRVPIYEKIIQFAFIDCPGKLLNNCSNEEINAIGNVEYSKKYKFNICSENFGASHPGYISEKIMNACLGGAIPIYFGELDAIDEKIFNKNRILFLNHENTDEIAENVKMLIINEIELEEFYRQPVFMESAYEAILEMDATMMKLFNLIRKIVY
jgi:hypothetical protein